MQDGTKILTNLHLHILQLFKIELENAQLLRIMAITQNFQELRQREDLECLENLDREAIQDCKDEKFTGFVTTYVLTRIRKAQDCQAKYFNKKHQEVISKLATLASEEIEFFLRLPIKLQQNWPLSIMALMSIQSKQVQAFT